MSSSPYPKSRKFTFEKKSVEVNHLAMAREYAKLSELEQEEDEEYIKELEELATKNKTKLENE